jgi:hypothetical protein
MISTTVLKAGVRNRDGFSLVELMVGILFITISILALYQMFITGTTLMKEEYHRSIGFKKAQAKMELLQAYQVAADSIPERLAGVVREQLLPSESDELPIPAVCRTTIQGSAERLDGGLPYYTLVKVEYSWTEHSGHQQKIELKSLF